ncbi:gliding motility-associated C-terminal domain-containing protein [Membranihabitans maritimus]|uniref:T9SS type B sorting domain-containing protein n=1 Tax=Membranihabitans maritimus TaxID=2904244 RepID=UPI001F1E7411|nr:gliding motility-associated C-terminal domain-containing protein [Membranihabitans maritimus]
MKIYNKLIVILLISLNSLFAQQPEFIAPRETPSIGTRANCTQINAGNAALRPFSNGASLDSEGNITLCYGQGVSVQHDGDFNLDEDPDASTPAGIRYAVFTNQPTTSPEIVNSNALFDLENLLTNESGAMIVAQADANGNFTAVNDGSFLTAAGLNAPQTLWFVPITVHNANAGSSNPEDFFEATGNDACTHVNTGSAFAITYLGPLTYTVNKTSETAGTIDITGGLPALDGSEYTVNLLNTSTNESINLSGSGNSFDYSDIDPNNGYQLTISDNQGCARTFNLSFAAGATTVEISFPDTTVEEGSQICIPVRVSDFTNIGGFQFPIKWDPSVLEYSSIMNSNPILSDFAPGSNYNENFADQGILIALWFSTGVGDGIDIEDNGILFEMCFNVVGSVGESTELFFQKYSTTSIDFADGDIQNLPFTTIPGIITVVPSGDLDFAYSSCTNEAGNSSSLNINIFGGKAPYTYTLRGPDPRNGTTQNDTFNINNLAGGNYTLEITDDSNISISKNITIGGENFEYRLAFERNTCSSFDPNGKVYIEDINTDNFDIEWTYNNQKYYNIDTLNNIAGGEVAVIITDQNNCSKPLNQTMPTDRQLSIAQTITTDPGCSGTPGEATINISGGNGPYTVTRSGFEETTDREINLEFLPQTSYIVTDDAGCSIPVNFDVDMAMQSFTFRDTTHRDIGCNNSEGGEYRIYVESENTPVWEDVEVYYNGNIFTGAYIANQSQGQIWLRELDPGDYTIQITGDCGAFNHDFTIENISENLLLDATVNPVSCDAGGTGSIDLTVTPTTGNYDFDWSSEDPSDFFPNTEDLTDLEPGTYSVTVTSQGTGCSITSEFTLSPGVVYSKIESEIPCDPGSSVEAGISIQSDYESLEWDTGEDTEIITVTSPGYYPFTLTSTDETCEPIRDSIYVRSQSGGVYITRFESTVVDECSSPDAIVIAYLNQPINNYDFSWDNGPLQVGQSDYRVFDDETHNLKIYNEDCLVIDTNFNVDFQRLVQIDTTVTDISCFGEDDGSILIDIEGGGGAGFNFDWEHISGPPSQFANRLYDLPANSYRVIITDETDPAFNPCPAIELNFEIEEPEELSVAVLEDQIVLPSCEGDSNGVIVLDMIGGTPGDIEVRYSYSGGANTTDSLVIENAVAGNYNFALTDDRGCRATTQYQLMEPEPISFTVPPIEEPACFGYTTSLTIQNASGGTNTQYQFSVDGGVPSPLGQSVDILGGSHTVTVFDENLCSASTAITVREPNPINIQFDQPDTLQVPLGQTAEVSARINGENSIVEYIWSPDGIAEPTTREELEFTAVENMFITLEVTDSRGCSAANDIFVLVRKQRDIGIPNAFTPNGDGNNDLLTVIPGPGVQSIQSFQVYDRYGGLLWQQENINPAEAQITGWDGSVKGQRANPGLYLLLVKVQFIDGLVVQRREDVLLIK